MAKIKDLEPFKDQAQLFETALRKLHTEVREEKERLSTERRN